MTIDNGTSSQLDASHGELCGCGLMSTNTKLELYDSHIHGPLYVRKKFS